MGFDNECILNIQSLPGEYFCPVCRTLIFPNEALQSQCAHLFCKPCLAYIVATTLACPYDGCLVTEADSKPLLESNKLLAETIGKVQVYCLYHRSGCQWQGTLSNCMNHCAGCSFGNSPVVCNRYGTQIVQRQVQEHAQTCPGLQPQGQQIESSQGHVLSASNQDVTRDSSASTVAFTKTFISTSTNNMSFSISACSSNVQIQNQSLMVIYPQTGVQAPMAEQWYRRQQPGYTRSTLQPTAPPPSRRRRSPCRVGSTRTRSEPGSGPKNRPVFKNGKKGRVQVDPICAGSVPGSTRTRPVTRN